MVRKKMKTEEEEQTENTADFGRAITALCEEKGISKDRVIETIEAALSAAYKKDYGKRGQNIRADFDEVSGATKFFLVKEVVDETTREFVVEKESEEDEKQSDTEKSTSRKDTEEKQENAEEDGEEKLTRYNPERDLTVKEAKEIKKNVKLGDIIEMELPQHSDYGRVAAQTAKQVIIQRIREAERDAMFEEYKNKEGELLSGVIQRIEGRNVFVDIGKSVGVLFPSEQIERENYRIGQRVKVYVSKVDAGTRGPGITLSRTDPEMVRKMFELEVPEIFAGTVVIKSIAREAGERSKIAVSSTEEGVDPIGSCVGQKGTRVQAVIDELGGEKIDIILWNSDISKFISAALSPAKVLKVNINEDQKEAMAVVPEDQLSLAIGKRGQNVRLAAKLTGWKIDISGAKAETEETENVKNIENIAAAEKAEEITETKKAMETEEKPALDEAVVNEVSSTNEVKEATEDK